MIPIKKWSDKNHPLVGLAQIYKAKYSMTAITLGDAKKWPLNQRFPAVVSLKYDGELNVAFCEKGKKPTFAGVHGTLKEDFPAADELGKLADAYMTKMNIKSVYLVGELYVLDEHGHTLPFNQTESILKAPKPGQDSLFRFAIFNWFMAPSVFAFRNFGNYHDQLEYLRDVFGTDIPMKGVPKTDRVHVVRYMTVDKPERFDDFWVDYVLKEAFEGLVVMSRDDMYWKIKTQFNVDVAPIAMKMGKRWAQGMYSSVKVALMDKQGNFVELANPNAFGDASQMKADTAKWKKRKLYEEGDWFFFEPREVAEVKYQEATTEADRDVYDPKTLRKVAEAKGVSLRSPNFVRWRTDKSINKNDLRLEQIPENAGSSGREEKLKDMGEKVTPRAKSASQKRITPIEDKTNLFRPSTEAIIERVFKAPSVFEQYFDPKSMADAISYIPKKPLVLDTLLKNRKNWENFRVEDNMIWGGTFKTLGLPDPSFKELLDAFPNDEVAVCGGAVRRWLSGEPPADIDLYMRSDYTPEEASVVLGNLGYKATGMGPLGMAINFERGDDPKVQLVTDFQEVPAWWIIRKFDWTVVMFGVIKGDDDYWMWFNKSSPFHLRDKNLVAHKLPNGDGELVNYRYVKYIQMGFKPTKVTAHKVVCHACRMWKKKTKTTYPAPDVEWPVERWLEAIR